MMRKKYDFSKAIKNPYAKKLKKQVTMRLDDNILDYFKSQANGSGIRYQTLINLYLRDCVKSNRELSVTWT